jgi:transposase
MTWRCPISRASAWEYGALPTASQGLHELKQFVLNIATDPEQLACIVETNHGLLITFLLEAGIPVYPVNPKTANHLRKAAGAKTDQIDAHRLSKLGRLDLGELRRLEPDSAIVQELKTLTRDQDALIQTQTRLVNQLTACRKRVLSCCLEAVYQIAATLHAAVFAGVSDA